MSLVPIPGSLAVVLSNAVGDGVMMMALVYNLHCNSLRPCVYGRIAEQLADWFPWCDIRQTPPAGAAQLARHETVVELYPTARGAELSRSGTTVALASLPAFRQPGATMLDCILQAGSARFGLQGVVRSHGLVAPTGSAPRHLPRRVVIHPTASHPEKTWSRPKFRALAQVLSQRGYSPSFIVLPDELAAWRDKEAQHSTPVHAFDSLGGVAGWVAEADWFIGNDSGPAHLASALGVPTLSLFMRRGLAQTWHPGWAPNRVVLPLGLLPGARMRERYWQRFLSVRRALAGFDALRATVEGER